MRKNLLRTLAIILCLTMFSLSFVPNLGIETVQAATKIKLSKTEITIKQGKNSYIKLSNANAKSVKWSSSNKSVATVNKGTIKGIAPGKATITAKYKNKSYKCKVTVKKFSSEYIDTEVVSEFTYADSDYQILKYTNNNDYNVLLFIETDEYDNDGYFIYKITETFGCAKGESIFYILKKGNKQNITIYPPSDVIKNFSDIVQYEYTKDCNEMNNEFSIIFTNNSSKNIDAKYFVIMYDENDNVINFKPYNYLYIPGNEKTKQTIRTYNSKVQRLEIFIAQR